jgi:hypothetical protein
MAPHWAAKAEHRWSALALRFILLVRVLWNLAFAVYVIAVGHVSFGNVVASFARFAAIDGALAFTMACGYLLVSPQRMLWLSPAFDAATRALLVVIAWNGPGVSSFPLTVVLYLGLIAAFATFDGLLDVMEGISLRREFGPGGGGSPLIASGVAAAIIGVVLFVADAEGRLLRNLLAVLSCVHALALASALRHVRSLLTAAVDRSAFRRTITVNRTG